MAEARPVARDACQVTIEVVPWLNKHFDAKGLSRVSFVESLPCGTTVRGLLQLLAERYPSFKTIAFQPGTGVLGDQVALLLNDSWQDSEDLDFPLSEGDKITLLPAFEGGSIPDTVGAVRHDSGAGE